jgi:ADP-heptose:LPS heptosyltransferase
VSRPTTPDGPGTAAGGRPDVAGIQIAVVRALPGIGDLLCALPALRSLRAAHPAAHVSLVGLPAAEWFVTRYPQLVDDLLVIEGVPGLPEVEPDPGAALRFLAAAQAQRFDLAVQLHGNGVTTNPLTTMLGAGRQVTAHVPGQWRPPGTSIPYPTEGPEIRRLLAVTTAAGCPSAGEAVDIPLDPDERAEARALLTDGASGNPGPYVCLHPGASRSGNRWPAARFASVGDWLTGAGLWVVLTGTADERGVVGAVARAMSAPAAVLCGRTSVGTLAALFAGARVVVSNDTGAAHVAAAVRAPSVVVFAPTGDPDRWAPLDRRRHLAVAPPPAAPAHVWPGTGPVLAAVAVQLDRTAPARPLQEVT